MARSPRASWQSVSWATAEGAAPPVSTLLSPGEFLRVLRKASAILRSGQETEAALGRVADLLVPRLADRVLVHARDNDGRLHPRVDVEVTTSGEIRRRDVPPGAGDSLSPGADAPAARALRTEATVCDAQRVMAIPLRRRAEVVGILELRLDREGPGRRYGRGDVAFLEDLGERVSLALQNLRLMREVEAARRVKSDFLAVMSHELRTPLTAIVGYADLLQEGITGPVTGRQVRQLDRVKESAWQLLELIDGILGYARYEGEEPELEVSLVEPAAILDDALRQVRANLREKGLELTIDAEPDLPSLRTDRSKAARILFQLLSNAEKFTTRGEVRVQVLADRDWVKFAVSDTGPGIASEHVEEIFEPFWQGEQVETRTKGGTGMGLSMARRLAELLSGEIRVESRSGEGSTFVLALPREGPHPTFP